MGYLYNKILLIAAAIFLLAKPAIAQSELNSCDTVTINAPAYLILEDTTIIVHNDSTAIICKKYIVLNQKRGYNLYSKILGTSQKHYIIDDLLKSLIERSNQDTMLAKQNMMKAEDAYTPYTGKIIRNIKIQVLKPFGQSINDTNLRPITTWSKALNASHIDTRDYIIRNKLLFKQYDTINPLELVENTNEITNLPYLQDATIVVRNATTDSVDVIVIAKDKFPWMPYADYSSINNFSGYLKQVNMMGLGQSLGVGIAYKSSSAPSIYVSDVNYYIDNIYQQISGAFNFNISDNSETVQVIVKRDLIPLSVRLGGGTDISKIRENIVLDPRGIVEDAYYVDYMNYEVWASYLFYNDKNQKNKHLRNTYLIPGISLSKRQYNYHPIVTPDTNSMYQNYANLIGNIAFVKQNYLRTKFVRAFGKAEYIPYGFQICFMGGYSWMEFIKNPYLGFRFAATSHIDNFGYLVNNLQIGSQINKNMVQGVVSLNLSYISSIINRQDYKYRFTISGNYTTGINRITNDLIYIGEDYGFVGLSNNAIYGQQRLFTEMDLISYTPWYLLGFRFAMFGFCSAGMIGDAEAPIFHNQVLTNIGIGVYIKNDFLAFNSLQFRVGYFPSTPAGISHFGISFNSVGFFDQIDFLNTKPGIIQYN